MARNFDDDFIRLVIDPVGAILGTSIFPTTTIPEDSIVETTDNDYKLILKIPGFSEKEISIETSGNKIVVNAEHLGSEKVYFNNKIHRVYKLSEVVKPENVSANLKDGILTIIVQRADTKSHKIEIKSK